VIVFKVNAGDFVAVDTKREPTGAGNMGALHPFAVAGKLVRFPERKGA
jgi:hypothetical protein